MESFFHFTKLEYVESIIIQGLLCNNKRRGIGNGNYKHLFGDFKPLFLTTDPKLLIKEQLGSTRGFILLKINIDGLNIEPLWAKNRIHSGCEKQRYEYVCFDDISPERISKG